MRYVEHPQAGMLTARLSHLSVALLMYLTPLTLGALLEELSSVLGSGPEPDLDEFRLMLVSVPSLQWSDKVLVSASLLRGHLAHHLYSSLLQANGLLYDTLTLVPRTHLCMKCNLSQTCRQRHAHHTFETFSAELFP